MYSYPPLLRSRWKRLPLCVFTGYSVLTYNNDSLTYWLPDRIKTINWLWKAFSWLCMSSTTENVQSKFLKSWLTGRLQGITVDTESLMFPGIILFFLAQPESQERACFLNVWFAPEEKLHFLLAFWTAHSLSFIDLLESVKIISQNLWVNKSEPYSTKIDHRLLGPVYISRASPDTRAGPLGGMIFSPALHENSYPGEVVFSPARLGLI